MDREMEDIVRQTPKHISYEKVKEIYERNDRDKLRTLMEIWDIEDDKGVKKAKDEIQTKWDDIRETCDAFDNEMTRIMENARSNIKKI
jgi:hypothetical protein